MNRIIAITVMLFTIFLSDAAEFSKEISFERGHNSSTLHGSVIRGDRNVYLLRVRSGQTISIKAAAQENNVAFSIYEPKASEPIPGTEEQNDLTSWSGTSSKSGPYRIVVGSSRGNATYSLQVAVQ